MMNMTFQSDSINDIRGEHDRDMKSKVDSLVIIVVAGLIFVVGVVLGRLSVLQPQTRPGADLMVYGRFGHFVPSPLVSLLRDVANKEQKRER